MCELHAPPSEGFETLRVRQCVKKEASTDADGGEKRSLLVGNPSRLQETTQLIDKMARGRWPVLVLGETGTGKEVVARSIHSANPMGPFITVDCSSMVGPLMESELFGHVKGSFTGAIANKTGLLELAQGGTAFLDEIGELPLDLQSKILRALQEHEFRPVGSNQTRHSDFRIIAATNRDLAKEVERGTFRRDLYYRLNVVTVRIAPLRDRKDDIPPLVVHFIRRYGNGHKLTAEADAAMLAYEWPGNVRELENAVQHMVAMNSGPLLHVHNLPSTIQNHQLRTKLEARVLAVSASVASESQGIAPSVHEPLPQLASCPILPLSEIEKRYILEALAYTDGDRASAASLLGIGRTTLYRKLKEYNIPLSDL
jgi:DNA-binding NtrC family response regulator